MPRLYSPAILAGLGQMPTFRFSVVLKSQTTLAEDLADRLLAAGCEDCKLSSSNGVVAINFDRVSTDLESAIRSALSDVQKFDCVVHRVEIDFESSLTQSSPLAEQQPKCEVGRQEDRTKLTSQVQKALERDDIFVQIDGIIARIKKHTLEPEFSNDIKRRESTPNFELADDGILEEMIKLIAFSQQVPAIRIADMVNRGVLQQIFGSFSPSIVSQMNPKELQQKYWSREWLSPIRFPSKLEKMVACAEGLLEIAESYGSYMGFLNSCGFPLSLNSPDDINSFWSAFDRARSSSPAFYRNFTSLCHLLQSLGFPCAKPDRIILNVGEELGILKRRKQHSELDQRKVVRIMQEYAELTRLRVPVVDLMFLIHGGQTEARGFVSAAYYTSSI